MASAEQSAAEQDLSRIIREHYPEISGIHAAATIFPMMTGDEFSSLVQNIRSRGLANDVVLTPAGLLLDGRNRLLACYHAGQEVRFKRVDPSDPFAWSWAQNVERRHLNSGQRAMAWHLMRGLYDAEAKQRQGARSDVAEPSANIVALVPGSSATKGEQRARDQLGAVAGVGGRYVDMARDVSVHSAPEIVAQVKAGTLSLKKAHADIAPQIKAAKAVTESPAGTEAEAPVITPDGATKQVRLPKQTRFNKTNGNVEWASWTWNPVTGCLHGCEFCYARAIVHNEQMAPNYPFGFEPAFYAHRLDAPRNTKRPVSVNPADGRVFVGSMADLFGRWVPDAWVSAVFDACMTAPEWEYLFLTKWPARYAMLSGLPRAWFGASVIRQADVARVEANMKGFVAAKGAVKWISLEPMLEPIVFTDLSWCDLVVIGAQTGTAQPSGYVPALAPAFDWVVDVVLQCRAAGVPYYLKPNLMGTAPGMVLPKGTPRGQPTTTLPF